MTYYADFKDDVERVLKNILAYENDRTIGANKAPIFSFHSEAYKQEVIRAACRIAGVNFDAHMSRFSSEYRERIIRESFYNTKPST